MELEFRNLQADEIECKATVLANKIEISLHSKAHTCTRMLNEKVGVMGWEKEYTNGNKNCIVRIWDAEKNRFISKEDCGGSLTEFEGLKGQASNGFKRVCALGWGLGIELYTQPSILLEKTDDNVVYEGKEQVVVEKYSVKEIYYNDHKAITRCVIVNSNGIVVYDGPDENGKSRVAPSEVTDDEKLIIPEDADEQNDEYDSDDELDCEKALPDNTDGFEDDSDEEINNDCMTQPTPFGSINYQKELEAQIKRTHVKRSDVLSVLKISSFEDIHAVSEDVLDETLRKLQAMPTFGK